MPDNLGCISSAHVAGMKLFIVDPIGVEAVVTVMLRSIYNFGDAVKGSIIGASRRDLRATLLNDTVERSKVMRFFL